METEKIKTVEEQIFDLKFKGEEFNPNDFNDWVKENELEAYNLCLKVAKQLVKQPPVSVMPSDGIIADQAKLLFPYDNNNENRIKRTEAKRRRFIQGARWLKEFLSLSKDGEPPSKERETAIVQDKILKIIRNNSGYEYVTGQGILANDVRIHKVAQEVVDLFKQRNK